MKCSIKASRRDFLTTGALLGGGLLVAFVVPGHHLLKSVRSPEVVSFEPNAFLRIGTDDIIRVILSKVEMGQGVWTMLPMLIAEELCCDINAILIEHSPVSKTYNHTKIPMQGTMGSSSTISEFDRYRQAGATARLLLVQAAANHFGVEVVNCTTEKGCVIYGGQRLRYGELAEAAGKLQVPLPAALKDEGCWQYIGKERKRLDSPCKVNGSATFGMDLKFPGLLTAVVAHPPVFGATVQSFDAAKAEIIRGIVDIVQVPSGIAVIAENYWVACRGRDALVIKWNTMPGETMDTRQQMETYRQLATGQGKTAQQKGDVAKALATAAHRITAEFMFPYLAHAPMEPLNCTVKISTGKCEIWTGTQLPGIDQANVAALMEFSPAQVQITTPFLGGGFGRRGSFTSDWIVEAVHIAKNSGRFIKLVWSREDDIRGGYYRPSYLHHAEIGLDAGGMPVAWLHRVVGEATFRDLALFPKTDIDDSSVEGVTGSWYLEAVPNHNVELHTTVSPVPVLPWRSVGKSHTCFVMETLVDQMAAITSQDPVDYRRHFLKDHPRALAILDLAAEKAGWHEVLPANQFRGVAIYTGNGSYIAQIVELSVIQKKIQVHRVVCVIDCGLAVNPDGVRAQMESCIVFGLSAALYGEITIENGRVRQSNFHNYRVLRINESPQISVYVMKSTGAIGGAGEPGVPPIAAAVANALFAATGKRCYKLPLTI